MSNVITISPMFEGEKEKVSQQIAESFAQYKDSYNEERWQDYKQALKNSVYNPLVDTIFVAKEQDEVIGSLQLYTDSQSAYNRSELEINEPIVRLIAVRPNFRGKGIAQALLKESIQYARESNAKALYLHASDRMEAAIRLYERYGFVRDTSKDFKNFGNLVKCYRFDL